MSHVQHMLKPTVVSDAWGVSSHGASAAPYARCPNPPDRQETLLRLYVEIARRGFRRYATYRGATIAGLFTNTIFGFMRTYVLLTVFRLRGQVGGMDARDVVTYAWMTQGLLITVFLWGYVEVAERIRDGSIVTDLYRPMDVQAYFLSQDLGRAAYHVLVRGIVPVLVGALAFGIRFPARPATWIAFPVSVVLAVVASFGFRFLLNTTAFWLLDFRGPVGLATIGVNLLCGLVVPLTFFPHAIATVVRVLPFAAMVQLPIEVFLEKGPAAPILALQALWAIVLLAAGRAAFEAGTRKVVIQGG